MTKNTKLNCVGYRKEVQRHADAKQVDLEVKENEGEETRSKAVREFLFSFQLSVIQPVPEIPRNQCVCV